MSSSSQRLQMLKKIIDEKSIQTVFQPIISLTTGNTIGYEALSRGPEGSDLEHPDQLFKVAEEEGLIWELEQVCRTNAIERSKSHIANQLLFINVDPMVINDPHFYQGFTKEFLMEYDISPQNIIFEITEKTSIEDFKSFRNTIDHYVGQGYKIAIDDTGAGYSGLRLLAETHPQFIKIDMELVRNIDQDILKRALMKTFYEFSTMTNIKIIAEGIETFEELSTLITIGIPYGQGFLLQRPSEAFLSIQPEAKKFILNHQDKKKKFSYRAPTSVCIGEISKYVSPVSTAHKGSDLIRMFEQNKNLMGIPVVEGVKPAGLIMRSKFYTHMASKYGLSIFSNRSISILMDHKPLVIDYALPIDKVSNIVVSRNEDTLYDQIIITREGNYHGIVTIKDLLEKTTQIELNIAKHSNPLTGLPGNLIIEERLKETIDDNSPYSVLYIDLDNFKAYNDVYGFENGDKVIAMTAEILAAVVNQINYQDVFLGHIGGDDFLIIVPTHDVLELCQSIIGNFKQTVKKYYSEEDQRRSYILAKNRKGIIEQYPLLTLSIAVVSNKSKRYDSVYDLAVKASQIKNICKTKAQNHICMD